MRCTASRRAQPSAVWPERSDEISAQRSAYVRAVFATNGPGASQCSQRGVDQLPAAAGDSWVSEPCPDARDETLVCQVLLVASMPSRASGHAVSSRPINVPVSSSTGCWRTGSGSPPSRSKRWMSRSNMLSGRRPARSGLESTQAGCAGTVRTWPGHPRERLLDPSLAEAMPQCVVQCLLDAIVGLPPRRERTMSGRHS